MGVVLVERKKNIMGLIGLVPKYSIFANWVPVRQGYMETDTFGTGFRFGPSQLMGMLS